MSIIARDLICYPIMGLTVPCEALQGRLGLDGCCSDDREFMSRFFLLIFNDAFTCQLSVASDPLVMERRITNRSP